MATHGVQHRCDPGKQCCGLASVRAQPRHHAKPPMDADDFATSRGGAPLVLGEETDTPHRRPVLEQAPARQPMELQMLPAGYRRPHHATARRGRNQCRQTAVRTGKQSGKGRTTLLKKTPLLPEELQGVWV